MGLRIRPGIRRAFRLALRRRDLTEREVEEELRTHFGLRVAQLIARGRSPAQAEREAIARLGGSWEDAMSQLNDAGRHETNDSTRASDSTSFAVISATPRGRLRVSLDSRPL